MGKLHDTPAYCNGLTARLREWSGTPEPLATLVRTEDWREILLLQSGAFWSDLQEESHARGMIGSITCEGYVPS